MSDSVSGPPSVAVTIDDEGRVVGVNRRAEEILGLPRNEAQGRPLAELIRQIAGSDLRLHVQVAESGEPAGSSRRRPHDGAVPYDALRAQLERTEEEPGLGTWDWDMEADRIRWSDNLYRILGLEPGEVTASVEYWLERVHPDDRERAEREAEILRQEGRLRPLAYRIVRADGELRYLHAWRVAAEEVDGRLRRLVGTVQDVTDRRRAEHQVAAHVAVTRALADWRTLEQGGVGLLRGIGQELDCRAGVLWALEGDVLVARVVWTSGAADTSELEAVVRQVRLPIGAGLAGRVWETGKPAIVPSLEDDPRFPAETVAGPRAALAVPAVHEQEVVAVLELFACACVGADGRDRLLDSLTGIGYQVGQFLDHHRGQLATGVLTARELEVLQLAAQGCSGPEIAERLFVSPATVRTHFKNIYEKYDVSDRAGAVAKALRDGLIQ